MMKNLRGNGFSVVVMAILLVLGLSGLAAAQKRSDRDIRDAVRSLNSQIDDFEYDLRYQMQSGSANDSKVDFVTDKIRGLRDSIAQFQSNFDRKRENRDDVDNVVAAAQRVHEFLQQNPQNRRIQDDWDGVKRQIERLGANYGVVANWSVEEQPQNVIDYPPYQTNAQTVGLSGTYQLDSLRSEKIDDVMAGVSLNDQQRADLRNKLTAPTQIAIDIRGEQITLATTASNPVSFTADGRDQVEQSATGKSVRLRATLSGDILTVSSLGGETDYTIKFTSTSNGQVMKVSRRITTDYLSQTMFAESVYTKTDSVARLGIDTMNPTTATSGMPTNNDPNGGYSDNDQSSTVSNGGSGNTSTAGNRPATVTTRPGNYVVPNGVVISGILENEINTKVSQNNDRFRLTVQTPDEFRGATIDGYISGVKRSGKVSGQSNITFNFERITLRNGQVYDFAGFTQSITDQSGKAVKIDNEGSARGDSQTKQSVKRGGIGAGIGAIIGAIAGGGKGAAIGAILGGGAGAGSVAIQGEDDIRLQKGSTISVQSSSPMK